MKDNNQIVLFFENGTLYNPAKVASEISEKYKKIGQPIILPIDGNAPKEANIPILIFDQNINFWVISNFNNIAITLFEGDISNQSKIIENIFKIFSSYAKIIRVGYIVTRVLDKKNINTIKDKYFKDVETINSLSFNLAWYNKIQIEKEEVNCWKRYFTDTKAFEGVVSLIDINTPEEKQIDINLQYLTKFMKESEEYIKNNKL
ncbi:MAG: hypothetical protein PHD03_04825 [Bacilli bacterium]|nr:hypothetical protein [Bacilli bacterium]